MNFESRLIERLDLLDATGNLRRLPDEGDCEMVDLSSNDYLGLGARHDLAEQFYASADPTELELSAVASRLLSARQRVYRDLETFIGRLYGREALLFNSGYHANTGIIGAIADKRTLILADRLVHASIIDGIRLSGAKFERFNHNDFDRLEALVERNAADYETMLVIVESIYSMDGDRADIDRLIDLKRRSDNIVLYVDEAHSFGVAGPGGLGLCAASTSPAEVDIIIGTLGKAAASSGAFAVVSPVVRNYLVNKARSLIFSTAIPPVNAAWSRFIIERIVGMDSERARLEYISALVADAIGAEMSSHIMPYIVGDAGMTVALSRRLSGDGVKVLPIRTPTVPPGTERLRISLSAAITDRQLNDKVLPALRRHLDPAVAEGMKGDKPGVGIV